ncbi:ferredoxin [candidate division MSBL1 archaeon SCGC-AAA259I09]|uniref:Ferredoxin n=1 Tax=candidate division MSBL1 archaeon SCGC-AAA259I09 TaxID=1698267 RepID=A0A133US64_9EURY|nr:ferredoxin [candidate division MSBL1 archaeon SCGC-AAA259I09]
MLEVNSIRCYYCGACASVCPLNLIDVLDEAIKVREGCTDCGLCENTCPVGAIKIAEE